MLEGLNDSLKLGEVLLGTLVPDTSNPQNLVYSFLIILISGFLSLTLVYVVTKRDEFWLKLDIFTKSALSLIVGILSYLFINLSLTFFELMKLASTGIAPEEFKMNYIIFVFMILYAYVFILLPAKFVQPKKKKIDQMHLLAFVQTSSMHILALFPLFFGLVAVTLFFRLAFLGKVVVLTEILFILGLILIYIAYSLLSYSLGFCIGKNFPFDLNYFITKLRGNKMKENKKIGWFKRTFTAKRIFIATKFSAIIGVSYWATTVYEAAFKTNQWGWAIAAFFFVALVLLIFGGSLLDVIEKD